jgi:hypothetical protein
MQLHWGFRAVSLLWLIFARCDDARLNAWSSRLNARSPIAHAAHTARDRGPASSASSEPSLPQRNAQRFRWRSVIVDLCRRQRQCN